MSESSRIYLIDGHATLYRAYHGIRSASMFAPGSGLATHAAFGFTKTVLSLLARDKPEYLAVAMDSRWPTFRHKRYPKYKCSRVEMPDDLRHQIPYVERICEAYGIPVFRAQGFEADDVLATLTAQAVRKGLRAVIVSGDKDILQLVREGEVEALDLQKAADKRYTPKEVEEKLGVVPEKVLDMFGLAGDTSDDIPGVPGVGLKTAAKLVRKYGSMEKVLEAAAAGKEKGKRGENLVKFAKQARLSRELAAIRRDVPVKLDLEAARVTAGDPESLIAVFRELGFREFLSTVTPSAEREEGLRYEVVKTKRDFEAFLKALKKTERFAFDLETDGLEAVRANIVGFSFSWKEKEAYYVPVRSPESSSHLSEEEVLEELIPVLEDPAYEKVGQNAKFDMLVLRRAGVRMEGLAFDTMVASYVLEPGSRSHGIDALALQHLGFRKVTTREVMGKGRGQVPMDQVELEKVANYACEDADITWRLCNVLEPKLKEAGLWELYRSLEMPLVPVLADLEWNGIGVERPSLAVLSEGFGKEIAKSERKVFRIVGHEFKIASPKQLAEVLYKELKYPVVKKTKSGPSTDSAALKILASKVDEKGRKLLRHVLEYRELSKLKSTYADALPGFVNPETNRIHASFNQTVTATGRLSSSDPNLQNIPVRTELGRAIRRGFVPGEKGWVFLSADYSQIELRVLAHVSGDERLVEAFRAGRDIHAAVAAELAGCDISGVTREMRRRAKAVNFGIIYGQGPYGLSQGTGMSVKEAAEFIKRYFERFEEVKHFREETMARARSDGVVSTLMGRIRYLPEINSDDVQARRLAERMAVNTVIQGSAADLIKKAMIDIHGELPGRFRARMLLQIHDELLFEVPKDEVGELKEMVVEKMSGAMALRVPLAVEARSGENWSEIK